MQLLFKRCKRVRWSATGAALTLHGPPALGNRSGGQLADIHHQAGAPLAKVAHHGLTKAPAPVKIGAGVGLPP